MERGSCHVHVLVLPLPIQGHINPMLQFSKRLASKGLNITFITASSMPNSLQDRANDSITVEPIFDGFMPGQKPADSNHYLERYKATVPASLAQLITKHTSTHKHQIKCLIYDSVLPWALDVALDFGVRGAPFFTQSCAVTALYYHSVRGSLRLPLEDGVSASLPAFGELGVQDLPSFVHGAGAYGATYDLLFSQFLNLDKASWLLWNTFTQLEDEIVNWMGSKWAIKPIGPTIPSMFLDKRLEDDQDYGLHLFKPSSDACMKWLDAKEPGSVVYVSFGSLAALSTDQMAELAWGLQRSNTNFLWVVRELEEKKLPSQFLKETTDTGLVVRWCPQLQVLGHKSVGCFLTHCGWNSTLEALSMAVPMVGMPQWTDQPTNAKWVSDVWRIGVRVKVEENGMVTREEIEGCIRKVMVGGAEMRRNAQKLREAARIAVDEGGSSDKNIEEFIVELMNNSNPIKP